MSYRNFNPIPRSRQILDFVDNALFYLQKKKILLRGVMTRKRILSYPKLVTMFCGRTESKPFTLGQVAGHGSFIMLAISYLESDFLNLRMYAVSGIGLSILFQYYREIPLWLPIGWNMLFLVINYTMIALLLKEKKAAENLSAEEKHVFMSLFEPHGMTSVEFLKLLGIAKRIETEAGATMIHQGTLHRDVYLLQSGSCVVKRDGEFLGRIKKYQFMGEMSFLRWQDAVIKSKVKEEDVEEEEDEEQSPDYAQHQSIPSAVTPPRPSVVPRLPLPANNLLFNMGTRAQFDFDDHADIGDVHLMAFAEDDPYFSHHDAESSNNHNGASLPAKVGRYFMKYVNYFKSRVEKAIDRIEELIVTPRLTMIQGKFNSADHHAIHETGDADFARELAETMNADRVVHVSTSKTSPRKTPVEQIAIAAPHETSDDVHTTQAVASGHSAEEYYSGIVVGMKGTAQVTCQENSVVYVWDFMELHDLIQENPRIGLCVEMCMSADLNNKFQNQNSTDTVRKYNQILTGALLNGVFVTEYVKEELKVKRAKLSISDNEHEQMVKRLGWTIEQYNAGNRFVGIESVTKYRNLLNHILMQSGSSKNGVRFLSTG
jgi:hypothetical protein